MKILKAGKLESDKLRGECYHCGCIVAGDESPCAAATERKKRINP